MSKPSGGIRSLLSLSAWGLPTPVVALACIGNVDIQVFSCADGESYFLRRLQAGGGVHPRSILSRAAMSKLSGGIRSLLSLSAWGLPTPGVALACIGNVDIQAFSYAGGRLYFTRRLQVYLFIIFHVQPISQGVTLLFFFTEKKKRSKKRKEFAFHLYYKVKYHPKITQETVTIDSHQQNSPGGANRRLLPP